jgi:hypothetical protein
MAVGKVGVSGYTRVVNGKTIRVKGYSQQRSLMDALQRAGRRPVSAQPGTYPAGRSMPSSPAKRKAAKKEMATTLNSMKKQAAAKKAAPAAPKGTFERGPKSASSSNPPEKKTPKGAYEAKPLRKPGAPAPKAAAKKAAAPKAAAKKAAPPPIKKAANNELTNSERNEAPFKEGPGRKIDTPPEDMQTPPEILRALAGISPTGRPEGTGTMADPIDVGDDLERAVSLIAEGKHIRLKQVDEVSMVLDRLAKRVEHAKKMGDKAPNFNLCLITVPGTNLFCTESKGVPRAKMPQLSGQPTEGSKAAELGVNEKGEAHIEAAFRQALIDTGVKVELKTVKASHLKASQAELDGPKVAGMSKAMEAGKIPDAPIFVTNDGYIVDGHHRWASKVAIDLKDGTLGDIDMPVEEIDLDIGAVLDFANEFALAMGIKPKGLGAAAEGVTSSDSADPLVAKAIDPLDAVNEAVAHLAEVVKKMKAA